MIGALTLDQLRILVAIEECGSFSAAGRKLRRVQSSISQAVVAMEASQGLQLFDRSTRTPTATEAGRLLTAQARQVLRQAELFESMAGAISSGLEPELSLAIDSFVPAQPVIRSLRSLRRAFPALSVKLYTERLTGAERRIRDRTAALAICPIRPTSAQDLQAYPLTHISLLPVVSRSHPLARESRPLTRDALSEHVQLILTDPYDSDSPAHSVVSPQAWRFVDLGQRLDFLQAGFGWCLMPRHLVATLLDAGELVPLNIEDPGVTPEPIPVYAIHDRGRPLKKAAAWLLQELQRQFSENDLPIGQD